MTIPEVPVRPIAPLAASVLLLLGGCGAVVGTRGTTQAEAPVGGNGEPTAVLSLKVGDCVPPDDDSLGEGTIRRASTISCSEPHGGEIFASLTAAGGESFPGSENILKQTEACKDEFKRFVGISFDDSELNMNYLFPIAESWANGDREILCIVIDPDGPSTGTLENAKR